MHVFKGRLEDTVQERTQELEVAMKKMEDLLHQMLPKTVAQKLALGESFTPESVDRYVLYIEVIPICNFAEIQKKSLFYFFLFFFCKC